MTFWRIYSISIIGFTSIILFINAMVSEKTIWKVAGAIDFIVLTLVFFHLLKILK